MMQLQKYVMPTVVYGVIPVSLPEYVILCLNFFRELVYASCS